MTWWLQWLTFVVSVVLQILLIASLRRGAYKEYPFIFVYCLVSLLTTVADAAMVSGMFHLPVAAQRIYFYRNDAIREFLLFSVVVSLIEHAMSGKVYRERVRLLLGLVAVLAVFLSLYIHSGSRFSLWMTQVTRDLSFGSVGLTLLLWSTLIASRKRDGQLLMITGGLGLQFTGEAIGQSLRQLSQHRPLILLLANLLVSVAHLIRLYVWREAFRRGVQENKVKPGGESKPIPRQTEPLSTNG